MLRVLRLLHEYELDRNRHQLLEELIAVAIVPYAKILAGEIVGGSESGIRNLRIERNCLRGALHGEVSVHCVEVPPLTHDARRDECGLGELFHREELLLQEVPIEPQRIRTDACDIDLRFDLCLGEIRGICGIQSDGCSVLTKLPLVIYDVTLTDERNAALCAINLFCTT